MTLFELIKDEADLLEAIEEKNESEAGTKEEREAEIAGLIDHYLVAQGNVNDKIDRYLGLIQSLKALAAFRKGEAARLDKLAKQAEKSADALSERLVFALTERGTLKLVTPLYKITVANNSKPQVEYPRDWDREPASAPEQFHKTKVELNKTAIREALESGEKIEGCEIKPPGKHLRIR